MSPEELERWIVPCVERLGAEPCPAMHFAEDVRGKVEAMMDDTIEACIKVADNEAMARHGYDFSGERAACEIAAAIRSRSKHDEK